MSNVQVAALSALAKMYSQLGQVGILRAKTTQIERILIHLDHPLDFIQLHQRLQGEALGTGVTVRLGAEESISTGHSRSIQ